jgi:hypothetical protein
VPAVKQGCAALGVHPQRLKARQAKQVDRIGQLNHIVGAMRGQQTVGLAQVLAGVYVEHLERHARSIAGLRSHAQIFADAELAKGDANQVHAKRRGAGIDEQTNARLDTGKLDQLDILTDRILDALTLLAVFDAH